MARWTETDRDPVDALVDKWRTDCLIADGSLLAPEETFWSREVAAELVTNFVDNILVEGDSFESKLLEQLTGQPREVIGLMAETTAIYFGFAGRRAATPDHKRRVLNQILAISDEAWQADGLVADAMEGAIGGPGQGFNSYRPYLLHYLVRFTVAVKALATGGERSALVGADADPRAFKGWLDEQLPDPARGAQSMRNILLHLLFPDHFERIAADDDKAQIVNALAGIVEGLDPADADVDDALLQIRGRLQELMPSGQASTDGNIDFYYTPLAESWDPEEIGVGDKRTDRGLSHLDALDYKKQVVLYGPPGTGKTYEAKQLAERLIRRQALLRWGPVDALAKEDRVREIVEKQVRRRQLHPAYSYEDFVAGLRIVDGDTKPTKGHLLELIDEIEDAERDCPDPSPLPWVLLLDEVNRVDLSRLLGEVFSAIDDRGAPIELSAATEASWGTLKLPRDLYFIGTMNLIDQSVEQLDFALRRRFFWLHSGFDENIIAGVVEDRWENLDLSQRPWLRRHGWEYVQHDIDFFVERATVLNDAVRSSPLLGPQYEIGHTYFFDVVGFISRSPKLQSRYSRRGHYLWSSTGKPLPPLHDFWSHSLEPLLAEYLAGLAPAARDGQLDELRNLFLAVVEK